jgi:uncharacterized protein YbjT (DUF2867 family)
MTILISGATGSVGSELANALARKGVSFRAMVRTPERAGTLASLPGVEIVAGDFDDSPSLVHALQGVERAFLLTPSTERAETQQIAFVEAAKQSGVRHIVKLSQWAANEASPVRFLRYHAAVEAALRASGMHYTFLRPNLFMQATLAFRESIVGDGAFFAPVDDGKISLVDVRDIAAVAATCLTAPGHEGKVYDLTGPEALTHGELAAHFSRALGRAISFSDVSPEVMRRAMLGIGLPPWQAEGLIEDYAHYRRGEAAVVSSDIEKVTGRAARSFAAFAADYANAFA